MFPLRDVHRPKRAPIVTRLFIAANLLIFAWQVWQSLLPASHSLIEDYGVRPRCFIQPDSCGIALPSQGELLWQPLLLSMFLHGGALHLGFNLLFLSVFGAGVEEKMGRLRFPVFYLVCGLFASACHIITQPFSGVPAIGASGAIAGVLGAYLVLLPRSWILTYLPPIWVFPVPAILFLLLWIVGQISSGLGLFSGLEIARDVAWMAHIGGFFIGVLWAWRFKPWWRKKDKSNNRAPI